MTILTIITNSNGHTVYFKEPIKNFQFIKLVSCSLFNSWINLKESGYISIIHVDKDKSRRHEKFIFPRGHYTPESMLYFFKNINYFSKINSPRGILVLANTETKEINSLSTSLHELFGNYYSVEGEDLVIKKFKTPHSYFIHCDLMNKTENLLNGKPSNLLAKFSIRGRPYEKIDYISPSHGVFREAASGDNYLHSLTISVKDENGVLFDFEFEIEIK